VKERFKKKYLEYLEYLEYSECLDGLVLGKEILRTQMNKVWVNEKTTPSRL